MAVAVQLTPKIGAEIEGIDLSQSLARDAVHWLKEQLVKHKVIFFRDQKIDTQQHLDFARQFGVLETHPVNPKEGFPEVLILHHHADNAPSDTAIWHSDVTWRSEPSLGLSLIHI